MRKLTLLFVALAVVLAGCSVDTTVSVRVEDDGSGVVTVRTVLDADAVQAVESGGSPLESAVRLTDLPAAGWSVRSWARRADGGAVLVLRKPFDDGDDVAAIVHEINGASGPVHDVSVRRDPGLLSTHYEVEGAVDLRRLATGVGDDPELLGRLGAQGIDVSALDRALTERLGRSLTVRFDADLPGHRSRTVGKAGRNVPVDASTTKLNTTRIALIVVAVVLLAAAVMALRGGWRRRNRARPPRTARLVES